YRGAHRVLAAQRALACERVMTGAKFGAQCDGKLVGVHVREMIAIGVGETFLDRSRARERQRRALKLFPSSAHHYLGVRRLPCLGSSARSLRAVRRRLVLIVPVLESKLAQAATR